MTGINHTATAKTPTVKERILLHLYPRRSKSEYEAPPEVTQRGIALGVGIRLRHVSQYVKPLISQGMVEHHSTHVRGRRRRQLAYFLTPLGRRQAEELRRALLPQAVPFRRRNGRIEDLPLARIYHEERRGASLLDLIQEFHAAGYVSETPGEDESRESSVVDFAPEAAGGDLFFGRERELVEVTDSLDRTPFTVVWGMAGIGKTALGAKVCENLRRERSIFWHRVRPWDGVMDLGLDLAGFLRAHGRSDLQAYLGRRGVESLTRIGEILGSDFREIGALLVLDDVHMASEEVMAFLSMLLEVLGQQHGTSALVLTREVPTFYSQRAVSLEGSVTEFLLKGLEPPSGAALLSEIGVAESVMDELLDQAGGNPLFLKLLAAGASLMASRGAWSSLETFIAREVEPSLNDEERECLEIASFYEIPVPREGLLLGPSGGLRTIDSLLSKALLEELEGSLLQAHDVLRHYFRSGMPRGRVEELGDTVVHWLLGQSESATERGAWGDAVSLMENALMFETDSTRRLSSLERLGGLRTSMGYPSGGLEAYRAALEEARDANARVGLHEKIAGALSELARFDEAEDEIEAGMSLFPGGPSPETVRLLLKSITSIHLIRVDYERAWECADRAASWMKGLGREPYLEGYLAQVRGLLFSIDPAKRDLRKARVELRKAEEIWRRVAPRALLWTYDIQVQIAHVEGRMADALEDCEKMLALAIEHGDVISRFNGLRKKALTLGPFLGRIEEAFLVLDELHRLAYRIQLPWPGYPLWDEAWLLELQGRNAEALEFLAYYIDQGPRGEFAPVFSEEGYVRWAIRKGPPAMRDYTWMAMLSAKCGDAHAARQYLDDARRHAPERLTPWSASQVDLAEALIHASEGEAEEAEARFRRMIGHFNDMECTKQPLLFPIVACRATIETCLLDYAEFLSKEGKLREAGKILRRIIRNTETYGYKAIEQAARDVLERLETESTQSIALHG